MKYLGNFGDVRMIHGEYYLIYNNNLGDRKYLAYGKNVNKDKNVNVISCSYLTKSKISFYKSNNNDSTVRQEAIFTDEVFLLSEYDIKMLMLDTI